MQPTGSQLSPEIPESADARRLVPDTADDGSGAQVLHGEVTVGMAKMMESLSDQQRDILRLRVLEGLSAEQTALALGSAPGAIRVTQHRALNQLRDLLTSTPQPRPDGHHEVDKHLPRS